jgi:ankyrin repeat protein
VPTEVNSDEALLDAAGKGDLAEVRRLIEGGADVNCQGRHSLTPLIAAFNHVEVIRYLLAQGADVNYGGFREGSMLMLAAYSGRMELVSLLLEAGADVILILPGGGQTALHMAAVTGQTEAARLLPQAHADVNRPTQSNAATDMFNGGARLWGETPLHFAAAYGDREMVEALLAAGADKALPNALGELPLAYAGRHKRPREILQLLK